MIEAIEFWNEPNNPAFWDAEADPQYAAFGTMVRRAAEAVRDARPGLTRVLGGISPIDPDFVARLA
jgi:hypothetical protein